MSSSAPHNQLSRGKRLILAGAMVFFVLQLAIPILIVPMQARALFGVGDVTITVGDIPRLIFQAISKAYKTAGDLGFKNILRTYLNNLAYNVATQIATGEKGQKPLFVTKPEELLKQAGDAAAGDFLDAIASDWLGKTECSGYTGTKCKENSSCPESFLLCPDSLYNTPALEGCGSSIEGKNKCIAAGCRLITCSTEDCPEAQAIIDSDAANDNYFEYGAPECASSFSLCDLPGPGGVGDPSLKIQLNILARNALTEEGGGVSITGRCPLTDIIDKFDEYRTAIEDYTGLVGELDPNKQFLIEYSKTFNPEATQLGAYLNILNEGKLASTAEVEANKFAQSLAGEFKPVTSKISGAVKTPAALLSNAATSIFGKSIDPYLTYTGTAIADAIGIFTNTLAQKLIQRYLFGIDPATSSGGGGASGIANFLGGSSPGVTAAKFLFADLQNTSYSVAGTTDVLGYLSSCPDPNNPTPATCVIDSRFMTAIQQELTVRQALEQGLIDGGKPFGFDSSGLEPEYYNGYPYRSLLILRKYRIIPVGWELAAQYGKQFASGNYSLNSLIADYNNIDSPFYKLVDPNWVLKSPEVFCRRQGAGEQIISNTPIRNEDTNNDGTIDTTDAAVAVVQRQGDYCADEQLCLQENADGTCARYGYCIEDRSVWKFAGTECSAEHASCQALTKSNGTAVSYVLSTVETNGCTADNAGCQWFCRDYNDTTNAYTCNAAPPGATGSGDKISFTGEVRQCDAMAAGCTEYIPRLGSGTNVLANSDFETFTRIPMSIFDALKDTDIPDDFTSWSTGQTWFSTPNCGVGGLAVSDAYEGFTGMRLASQPADCPGFPATGTGTMMDGGHLLWNLMQPTNGLEYGERVEGRTYSMSFYAKTASDDTDCNGSNGKISLHYQPFSGSTLGDEAQYGIVSSTGTWTRYSGSFTVPEILGNDFYYLFLVVRREANDRCDVVIDNIQFEEGGLSAYKTYEDNQKVYLQSALSCNVDEVGCEAFTSTNTGRTITGVISSPGSCDPNVPGSCDQCPADYVGCSAFRELSIERPPYRPARDPVSFVPDTGQSCPASAVGCEEYTNLEIVAQGGEGKEYYSYIRMCVPNDDAQKRTYYTWEGSNEFGFQLREYGLKKSNQNDGPCTNIGAEGDPIIQAQLGSNWPTCIDGGSVDRDGDGTDEEFYNPATCDPADVGVNPDCTEYYDTTGTTYYLLRSRVVFAADDCKNFRNSNDGPNMIYHMVPGQGISCQAAYAGCRAYKGNAGDNTRDIYVKDFEDGSVGAWTGNASISTEATSAGGHSMLVSNSAAINNAGITLGFAAGNQYTISFWARSAITAPTNISFALNTTPSITFTGQATALPGIWNKFTVGPIFVPVGVDPSAAQLVLYSNNAFYIDTIAISEVVENIYRVKGSYTECSGYEGCDQYSDRNGSQHFLKSFTRLCGEDKVGCTAMLDTQNSSSVYESTYTAERYLRGDVNYDQRLTNDDVNVLNAHLAGTNLYTDEVALGVGDVNIDSVINAADATALQNHITAGTPPAEPYYFYTGTVPQDETVFIVNDPARACGASQSGCERLGKPSQDGNGNITSFSDVYLVNDPDRYGQEMCTFGENQCDAYTAPNGSQYYFKDPGQKLCEFKRVSGQDVSGWYKITTNQGAPDCPVSIGICSGGGADDGKLCNASNDCASNFCNRNQNIVPQPADGWVGSCPASASGCTEYRDPEQIQSGSEIVSRNYSENGGFESFITTANPSVATDGVIDTALADIFPPWASSQTSAGRCTLDANRTCNTNVNCSAHGAGTCDTSQRVACGMRIHADSQANTGSVAARVKSYDHCGKSVNSSYPNYRCAINSATLCSSDADCGGGTTDYCIGDTARYLWYGVQTDAITDNRAFKVSFHAQIDPNDATCDPSNSANVSIGFQLVRTINNRPWPDSRTEYRPYTSFDVTSSWTEYENVTTFGSVDPGDWYNVSGPIEEVQNRFSMAIRRAAPTANTCDLLIDSFSIVETSEVFDYVPYYYIDETVDQTSCNGLVDREEGCRLFNDTSNPELPFVSTLSVDGEAPALCTNPDECDSNAVINVIRDRECKRWLECETSVRQEDAEGNVEELCLSRYVCEELDPETGQCTKVGEYESVNQTYDSPAFVNKIKNYTGLVLAGLDWDRRCTNNPSITCTSDAQCGSGTCDDAQIYEGSLPVAAMEEVGAISIDGEIIEDGDMGDRDYATNQRLTCPLSSVTAGDCPDTDNEGSTDIPLDELSTRWLPRAWNPTTGTVTIAWAEEDINNGAIPSPNSNLDENNVALVKTSGNIGAGDANWNGIAYNLGIKARRNEEYYASFRLRWAVPPSAYDTVRVQLGYVATNGNQVDFLTLGDFAPSDQWQEYVLGPVTVGDTNSGNFVNYDSIQLQIIHNYQSADPVPSVEFFLDDISLKPVLRTKEDNQGLLSRDCRLYASTDSPYCVYTDENNTTHKGWQGYCLEHDPRYPKYCLNWWPVDLLKGDSSAFGSLRQTGYAGRRPLYECVETDGNANQSISFILNGAIHNTNVFTGFVVENNSSWYVCDDTTDAGEPKDHGALRGSSPLLDHAFGYRRASATQTYRVDKPCGDWNNDDDCDQYGDLENHAGVRNCNVPGIIFGCDDGAGEGEACGAGSATINADPDDMYYKWEIESIAIIGQRWSHGGNFPGWEPTQGVRVYNDPSSTPIEGGNTPDGPAYFIFRPEVADAHKPAWCTNCWSATWSEYSGYRGNYFTLTLNFDNNQRLVSYATNMSDVSDGGAFWALPVFYLKEQCVRVAQVVTEDQDKAWFERTDRNSPYIVPNLLYTYTQDFTPYGGIVQPEPVSLGPTLWSYDLSRGPLAAEKRVNSDLARAGTPFSYSGPVNTVGRLCSAFVQGAGYLGLNECRNKADVTKCLAGPDGNLGTTQDNGYCIGVGAGFCQKNSNLYCTPATAAIDCIDDAGNDHGPCIVGSCVGGGPSFEGKLCGGTCNGGVNAQQVCGQPSDCPGSTCALDMTYPGGACNGGVCRVGADERGINTAAGGVDHLKRLFAKSFALWTWCDTASGGICTLPRTYNVDNSNVDFVSWNNQYSNMQPCPYVATAGRAVRPNYPNDYCGVPPVVDSVLCGAGGQPSTSGCQNVSVGQLVQLTFNINADPNQKPIKLIEVDFDNDGNADYSSVGTYDSGTVFITHEYTIGGAYPIRVRLVDNWDWCGVLKGGGSSCPSGDCRYQADGTPCTNTGWVDTGVTANVNP